MALPTAADVPDRLLNSEQWVCWRTEERNDKPTKVPVNPATGRYASATDADTWGSFESCRSYATDRSDYGIGFVFTEDDSLVGVDLDDCREPESGAVEPWAESIIEQLDSYTEISPSGTGFHVLVAGSFPDDRNRRGELEVYQHARFFTVTGDHVSGTPRSINPRTDELVAIHDEALADDGDDESGVDEPEHEDAGAQQSPETADAGTQVSVDDEELLERAQSAANGEKFKRLWNGHTGGYESHSEADMALCSMLAFWTGGDANRMDRLFRNSGLMRPKWDDQHYADGSTYGETTIQRAIAGTSEVYDPTPAGTPAADDREPTADERRSTSTGRGTNRPVGTTSEHLERIAELKDQLENVIEENERLQAELEAERDRRQALEAKLEETDGDGFVSSLLDR